MRTIDPDIIRISRARTVICRPKVTVVQHRPTLSYALYQGKVLAGIYTTIDHAWLAIDRSRDWNISVIEAGVEPITGRSVDETDPSIIPTFIEPILAQDLLADDYEHVCPTCRRKL